MPIRLIANALALCLVAGVCSAELSDETKAAAVAHQKSIFYVHFASEIFGDIDIAQISDEQILEWLDEIVQTWAVCQIEALDYLGPDIADEVSEALASGADEKTVYEAFSGYTGTEHDIRKIYEHS